MVDERGQERLTSIRYETARLYRKYHRPERCSSWYTRRQRQLEAMGKRQLLSSAAVEQWADAQRAETAKTATAKSCENMMILVKECKVQKEGLGVGDERRG